MNGNAVLHWWCSASPVKKRFPTRPANPERLCWGCGKYCAADNMLCGNGSDRTQHPYELWGEDWQSWGSDFKEKDVDEAGKLTNASVRNGGH